jgi:hypothetical protein
MVLTHEGQGHQHLARKPTYQRGCESHKAICLYQLVEVDTEEFHSDAQVVSEIKMFRHLDNVMFLIGVL